MKDDFLSLIFPKVCYACGKSLFKKEECVCTYCHYHLPRTNFHMDPANPVLKLFWGRVDIRAASSMYLFNKGGKVQKLIHQLKYRGKKEIGVSLGKYYGKDLRKSDAFAKVEVVMPVPLHLQKLKKRGYNQSEMFAQGLAESLEVKHDTSTLVRTKVSQTQTKKSRFDRWKNVEEIFHITDPEKIRGKHILLVDDVVTTGSTLEACAAKILEVSGTTVSVATTSYTLL